MEDAVESSGQGASTNHRRGQFQVSGESQSLDAIRALRLMVESAVDPSSSCALLAQAFWRLVPGCRAQTCDANSLSRWVWKFCFISCKDAPRGGPGGLNTQAQSEQPQPSRCTDRLQTIFFIAILR